MPVSALPSPTAAPNATSRAASPTPPTAPQAPRRCAPGDPCSSRGEADETAASLPPGVEPTPSSPLAAALELLASGRLILGVPLMVVVVVVVLPLQLECVYRRSSRASGDTGCFKSLGTTTRRNKERS